MTSAIRNIPHELYHGSCKEIREFLPFRYEDAAGIYFTDNFDDAVDLARCNCIEDGDVPTVMVAHVDIKNPFLMYGMESHEISFSRRDELIALGRHDGVIGINPTTGERFEFVAFDPKQVTVTEVRVLDELSAAPAI